MRVSNQNNVLHDLAVKTGDELKQPKEPLQLNAESDHATVSNEGIYLAFAALGDVVDGGSRDKERVLFKDVIYGVQPPWKEPKQEPRPKNWPDGAIWPMPDVTTYGAPDRKDPYPREKLAPKK
jgi:hypothetical protein